MKFKTMILVHTLLPIALSSIIFFAQAGITLDTPIATQEGFSATHELNVGDLVTCTDLNGHLYEHAITALQDLQTYIVDIYTEDGQILSVSQDQKIFLPQRNQWVPACKLIPGDLLLQKKGNLVGVTAVKHNPNLQLTRQLEIDRYHNFFAGKNGILMHNIVLAAPLVWGLGGLVKLVAVASIITARAVLPKIIEKMTGKNIRPYLQAIETHTVSAYQEAKKTLTKKRKRAETSPRIYITHDHTMDVYYDHYPNPNGFQPVERNPHHDLITTPINDPDFYLPTGFCPYQDNDPHPRGFQPIARDTSYGIIYTASIEIQQETPIITPPQTVQDLINGSQAGQKTKKTHQYIRPPTGFQ